ncbi:hypothetical protein [Nocardioides aurantiacus]|uniref:hypothetical protein n=1 Tax=Nocardioides aurantiacus TaxID=86796 RepID=UPI00403F2FBB
MRADEPIQLQLANEHGADPPLWDRSGHIGAEGLGLSEGLSSDLSAFAARWEAAVAREVVDDRYDGVPVVQRLVGARYDFLRSRPAERRRRESEDRALRELGESLRERLQHELGDRYRVTYEH